MTTKPNRSADALAFAVTLLLLAVFIAWLRL